jgi:hypothetical protein
MNHIENTLTFNIAFAIYPTRAELLGLECSRLPWIAAAGASSGLPLVSIVQTHLVPLLNAQNHHLKEISSAIKNAAAQFSELLQNEFSICCNTRFDITFEEQHEKSIKKFAERLKIPDPEIFIKEVKANSPLGVVTSKNFKEIANQKAEKITPTNFSFVNPEIEVIPGREVCFVLKSKERVNG